MRKLIPGILVVVLVIIGMTNLASAATNPDDPFDPSTYYLEEEPCYGNLECDEDIIVGLEENYDDTEAVPPPPNTTVPPKDPYDELGDNYVLLELDTEWHEDDILALLSEERQQTDEAEFQSMALVVIGILFGPVLLIIAFLLMGIDTRLFRMQREDGQVQEPQGDHEETLG